MSTPNPYGAPGEPPLPKPWRPPPGGRGDLREKGWAPPGRLVVWWVLLLMSVVVFYVLLTPIWLGLRAAAWVAELNSRRKSGIALLRKSGICERRFRSRDHP